MKNLLLSTICFLFCFQMNAQEATTSNRSNTISLGYPAGVFDSPELGLYVGYNKEWVKRNRFSWEGQASFSYSKFDRDSDLFAHDGGEKYTVILSVGPRVYLNKPTKKTRLFLNLLVGPGYLVDTEYRNDGFGPEEYLREKNTVTLGYSTGAFLQFNNKFLLGFSYETTASWVLKVGYKF